MAPSQAFNSETGAGAGTDTGQYFPDDPNEDLGFEINPHEVFWSFMPEYYPTDFTHMKEKELSRYGGNCAGESVSIKSVKNREFHIGGMVLEGEVSLFNSLVDMDSTVDLLSPVVPDGGMECYIKKGELGNEKGWDPHNQQRLFKFTLDLVSTGRDERESERNSIVTAIVDSDSGDYNGAGYGF